MACPLPKFKVFSFSCSFSEHLTKSCVGAPSMRVGAPPTGNPGSVPGNGTHPTGIHTCVDMFSFLSVILSVNMGGSPCDIYP